jgi:hypothetical protein
MYNIYKLEEATESIGISKKTSKNLKWNRKCSTNPCTTFINRVITKTIYKLLKTFKILN